MQNENASNRLRRNYVPLGDGAFEVLAQDPMGKALIDAATKLMQSLTSMGKKP